MNCKMINPIQLKLCSTHIVKKHFYVKYYDIIHDVL